MIVVADTSVLNYLIRLKQIELLPKLYGRIVIAYAVQDEMLASKAPIDVRTWMQRSAAWIDIESGSLAGPKLPARLGAGERETIEVALKISASEVLMDDNPGRLAAETLGLHVAGTLAVLLQASRVGLIDFEMTLRELKKLGFRLSERVEAAARRLSSQG